MYSDFDDPFRSSQQPSASAERAESSISADATVQRGTSSTTVVISNVYAFSFTASMVTRHMQSLERWGSGTFTEQRRIYCRQRHTPRLHVHPHLHVHTYILAATRRHDYTAGVCTPVSLNLQKIPNPYVRLHGRSHLLSHTLLELRGACFGLAASVDTFWTVP